MTEPEWLASSDPTPMLEFLRLKTSERKFIQFACTHLRGSQEIPADEWYWEGIDKVELQTSDWNTLRGAVQGIKERLVMNQDFEAAAQIRDVELAVQNSGEGCDKALQVAQRTQLHFRKRYLSQTIRDIFGNPFHPVALDPSWLTSTVVSLAGGIYNDRAFDRLPILADALQDAGCESSDILDHCRSPGPHVRGCWAMDLLLGKT